MTQVAKPRQIVPKSRFRIEIDQIGDLRANEAGPLKVTFGIIETDEGGAPTLAEMTTNGYRYDPITVVRPLTEDDALAAWVESKKAGTDDKRNGIIYALDASGRDFYRWTIEEIEISEFEEFAGDAKATTESMMERITLRYRERGKRERLQ